MGQKLGVVYTVITVVFFIILAVIFVLRLNLAREENSSAAAANLQVIRQTAREAYSNPAISNERFRDTMRQISDRTPMLQLIVVYSYTGGTDYLWARDKSYLPMDAKDISRTVGIPQLRYNELTTLKITDSFDTSNTKTYFVTGLYMVIGNADIFPLLRDTLVLVLLYALVALLITVLLMVTSRQRTPAQYRVPTEYRTPPVAVDLSRQAGESGQFSAGVLADDFSGAPAAPPNRDRKSPSAGVVEAAAKTSGPVVRESKAEGLVSPKTGLSFRDHLERRLTLELERAAFNEQDLSAIMVHFPGLKTHPELYVSAAQLVLSHFAFEDLTFEFDEESFFVILPNAELNAGIRSAEAFQRKSIPFARQHRISVPRVGLSSRNGRLTDGNQLLKEARQAAARAVRDASSPIVGFHPDPQRYRAYVAGRELSD